MKEVQPLAQAEIEQGLQRLPVLSVTVTKLLELTQRDDVNVEQVARTVALDPGLSTRLLSLANSPFFGLAGQIVSINQACMVLGMNTVCRLAAAVGMGDCFKKARGWRGQSQMLKQAMTTAFAAQTLALHCDQNSETAFVAGMLHNLGELVMAVCFPDSMQRVQTYQEIHGCELAEAERAVFGMDHGHLGTLVAKRWCLPVLIQQVIGGCQEMEENAPLLVDIVCIAGTINNKSISNSPEKMFQSLPDKVVRRLRLDVTKVAIWMTDVEKKRVMMDLLAV